MALEVIGAGFGRTGTLSLKNALETLGLGPCYHMLEVGNHPHHIQLWRDAAAGRAVDWDALFGDYRAAVDWPSCNYWASQMAAFPQAKVVLSRRDFEPWYKSVMNTIYPASVAARDHGAPEHRERSAMVFEVIWDGVFGGRMDDVDHVRAIFEAHNQAVVDGVPADRLLVYTPGDGWPPLCEFFECDVPKEDYPQVNTTADFQKMVADAQAKS